MLWSLPATIRYTLEERDEYLLFIGEGTEGNLQSNIEIHRMIVQTCMERNCRRILVDDRNVVYTASAASIYELAKYYAATDVPRYIQRAAVLANPANMDMNQFYENTAQNRNIDLRIFYDLSEAERWLINP